MKAIRFHKHGGPEVLQIDQIPEPPLKDGSALVQIKFASVNHLDIWLRKGLPGITIPMPHILGADASGIVKEAKGTSDLKPGDRVYLNPSLTCNTCEFCAEGNSSMCTSYSILGEHCDGTYTEFVTAPAQNVLKIPDGVPFETASAAPLTYLTAWRMLMTRARLKPSEDVLVISAGAGVGVACVQIAKIAGARVLTTSSSEEKCKRLKELGADIVINHKEKDFAREIRQLTNKRGVDVVVDYTGKETWQKSLLALKRGGRLVTCGATSGYDPIEDIRHIFYRQLDILGSTMGNAKELQSVMKLVFAGKLKPVIDRILPLADAKKAHELIESRAVFGKILLQI